MESSRYIVETFDLCKNYKGKKAVDHVNMHIEKGDIYGFVGENGAGKTTVIRLLTGLANATSGNYALLGVDARSNKIYAARRKTGAIVEAVSNNRSFTALENLKVQATLCGVKKTDEELIKILNSVGLNYEEIKNKKTKNFSLGMRQRLGLASIMVSDPELIILDEPMNGLDPKGIIEMREVIINLNKEKGVTFLISSHILSELEKMVNKVGFLSHGKLLEEISMDELRSKARRKLTISFTDEKDMKDVIKGLKIESYEIEKSDLNIFDLIDINDAMSFLTKNKIKIRNIGLKDENIEDYYIKLVVKGEAL